jgi:serine/threonine-protein kinase
MQDLDKTQELNPGPAINPPIDGRQEVTAILPPPLAFPVHAPLQHTLPLLGPVFGTAVVKGTGPNLTSITNALRQERLRAAALYLISCLVLFFIWRVSSSHSDFWIWNLATTAGLATALYFVRKSKIRSERELSICECAIFTMVGLFLAFRQAHSLATIADDFSGQLSAIRAGLIGTILLMFTYAMLIPNTWKSSIKTILPIALIPALAKLVLYIFHRDASITFWNNLTKDNYVAIEAISENCVFVLLATALSIYSIYVLNALRTEVYQAKKLNQYRLVKLIGSGGMGDVYLAEHQMMKRPCALKLIRPDKAADARALARFTQEVQSTAKLSHPNTIEIYDYGRTDDGTFYYVMEYLPGMSLQDLIERYGPMPAERVIFLLRQACGALAEAHASGLIHRDLKPANIFSASRGGRFDVAKLLDFGLVKDVSDDEGIPQGITRENTVQGTPLYMAPEQVMARTGIDHRIDIYAMGGVAFTLLTNRPPFERDSRIAVMAAHAHDPVTPPSQWIPSIPKDLEAVILKCLAKKADDRYQDALSLEKALAACESANEWTDESAQSWWASHEPGTTSFIDIATISRQSQTQRDSNLAHGS